MVARAHAAEPHIRQISIFGGMVAAALLCGPVIALTIALNVSAGGDAWTWLLLPTGALYGTAITVAGLRLASPRTASRLPPPASRLPPPASRLPEILTAVSRG